MAATTKTRKRTVSEIGADLAGFVTMANADKVANKIALKLNVPAAKAKGVVSGIVRRLNNLNGMLPARSKGNFEALLSAISEIRPALAPMVDELRTRVAYKSGKTGKRENSWIRDLLAGMPRLQNDGSYYAFVQVTKEQAQAICDEMGVELPTEVSE